MLQLIHPPLEELNPVTVSQIFVLAHEHRVLHAILAQVPPPGHAEDGHELLHSSMMQASSRASSSVLGRCTRKVTYGRYECDESVAVLGWAMCFALGYDLRTVASCIGSD